MKLWAVPCRATQDGLVMVESSDKMWSTGEGNGKPVFCLENPMNSMKNQKDRTLKDELPRSVGALYATGDEWRNNLRKNDTQLWMWLLMEANSDRCCQEQYCIGTWNVRPISQDKLEVVKQEMARVNIDILGISKLKWSRMGEFNSDDHLSYLLVCYLLSYLLLWARIP